MEPVLFAVAIKGGSSIRELNSKTEEAGICTTQKFNVPSNGLRVGTLDTLMSLSDDLIKMDTLSEATVWKIYRQLTELKDTTPTVMGVDVATYAFKQFEWDEAKFQLKTPLRDLCESISGRIGGLDEELKSKLVEYNNVKGSLQQSERKAQGNLLVRGLTDIVTETDMRGTIGSDTMTTILLVIPKHQYKEFLGSYETVCQFVVPRSAKLIAEDSEMGLYGVVVFKKTASDFAAAAREKRWTIRDFVFEPNKVAEDMAKKEEDVAEEARLKGLLTNWCQINFAEAYTMMMHLKAVRVFVESVLRYGLMHRSGGPNFNAFLMQPKKGKEQALHSALTSLYGGSAASFDGDDDAMVPGAQGEFYPYVFVSINTDAPNQG
jgi:V-type H+-transporting ATPase subunit C